MSLGARLLFVASAIFLLGSFIDVEPRKIEPEEIEPFSDDLLEAYAWNKPGNWYEMKPIGRLRKGPNGGKASDFSTCFALNSAGEPETKRDNLICLGLNFYIVGADDRQIEHLFHLGDLEKLARYFEPSWRTKIIVPGFRNDPDDKWMLDMRDSLLKEPKTNVIRVYWHAGSKGLYGTAVANTQSVTKQLIIFLYYLCQVKGCDFRDIDFLSRVHVIGHSLGAHIAGLLGADLTGQIDRITGLDPAGPSFEQAPPNERLDSSDAKFVDVFHTNAGNLNYLEVGACAFKAALKKLWPFSRSQQDLRCTNGSNQDDEKTFNAWFGISLPIGHLDYYANGGSKQPGCDDDLHICDHGRANYLFIYALERERHFRSLLASQDDKSQLMRHSQLAAFKADDYSDFRSGDSIERLCPELLDVDRFFALPENQKELIFNRCAVPIDLTGSGAELKIEYEKRGLLTGSKAHYFDTLAEEPFVSTHYLLKVNLEATKPILWRQGCRVAAILQGSTSPDEQVSISYFNGDIAPGQLQFMMPVVDPTSLSSISGSSIVDAKRPVLVQDQDEKAVKNIEKMTPGKLTLVFTWNPLVGMVERMFTSLMDAMSESSKEVHDRCFFEAKSIELVPLSSIGQGFSLVFKPDSECQSENPCFKRDIRPIHIDTTSLRGIRLLWNNVQNNMEIQSS